MSAASDNLVEKIHPRFPRLDLVPLHNAVDAVVCDERKCGDVIALVGRMAHPICCSVHRNSYIRIIGSNLFPSLHAGGSAGLELG